MDIVSLPSLTADHLKRAREDSAGRSAHTVHGGRDHRLRQTVIALLEGRELEEHESPGEATLQVLRGRVRVTAGEQAWDGAAGDYLVIPPARHDLTALEDSAVLLTVVTGSRD